MTTTIKIVLSERTTLDVRLWDSVPGKERAYISNAGKDAGFYDINEDCLYGVIVDCKAETKAKVYAAMRAAFTPPTQGEMASATLVSTYFSTPCAEENDELSQTKVGVYRTEAGKTFERVIEFAAN